jgi:NAD(P)-dependent dehydrogenase (short-subunit alcohol dehydrogenase family)
MSPGLVVTPTVKAVVPEAQIRSVRSHALMPYLGEPEDLAAVVAFLASDDARNVSGHIIPVDGGYVSHMPHYGDLAEAFFADPSKRPESV